MVIRTPDQRLRVFVSSTLKELAEERKVVHQAIQKLRLTPVMFETGARPHPAQELYQSYLSQSNIFIAIYWQNYGWVAPGTTISGLEDEYNLSSGMPRLIYIKNPAPDREPGLTRLLDRIRDDNTSCYTYFSTLQELKEMVQDDLALLLSEHFATQQQIVQPPGETGKLPLSNVPVPRNTFVDRVQELAAAIDLLQRDDIALLTLTGAGGTGKSRLALQIGLAMLPHFKDGVCLVRLEPINDPYLVIPTIAKTLGITENPSGRPLDEMLKDFLHNKQMLLLLDNFEQLVEAGADIAGLLEACPQVKALVTSRTPLRLRLEKELPVPPLAVPIFGLHNELDQLSQYGAVELFIQRARGVKPNFTITNTNAAAVAEICFRLDGLPLAIELAASRIKLLTPHELLARLDRRFDLLRGGTRDLPERQRTLRRAIDWSYNLLTETEKMLFRRLSIFVNGWTLEAAETVCDLDGDLAQELDDALASLIDNNLVTQLQDTYEQSRFGMLATIHEYASERLIESGEADAIHCQHAGYFLDFVKVIEPRIRSAERYRWYQEMVKEFENIRAVLDWICHSGNCVSLGQTIMIILGRFWVTSSYTAEGKKYCTQIQSITDASTPVSIRAGLLAVAAWIAWAQADSTAALANVEECLAMIQGLELKTTDELSTYAMALVNRGKLASAAGDLATATASYQRGIEIFQEIEDHWDEALALSWLGDVALLENNRPQAEALHNRSIELARRQGDPWAVMPPLTSSGQIALLEGDLAKARIFIDETSSILRNTGDHFSLCWALNNQGHIALMGGEPDQAGKYFLEGLTLASTLGNISALLVILTGVASIIAMRTQQLAGMHPQDPDSLTLAGRICGATEKYIHLPGIFMWPELPYLYKTDISQVRSSMEESIWKSAYSEGERMPLEQAVALAVQILRGSGKSDIK